MAKNEKPLSLDGIPAYEEWQPVPGHWKVLGKKDATTKKGESTFIVYFDDNGVERQVWAWALRREPGKQFEVLKRAMAGIMAPAPARV